MDIHVFVLNPICGPYWKQTNRRKNELIKQFEQTFDTNATANIEKRHTQSGGYTKSLTEFTESKWNQWRRPEKNQPKSIRWSRGTNRFCVLTATAKKSKEPKKYCGTAKRFPNIFFFHFYCHQHHPWFFRPFLPHSIIHFSTIYAFARHPRKKRCATATLTELNSPDKNIATNNNAHNTIRSEQPHSVPVICVYLLYKSFVALCAAQCVSVWYICTASLVVHMRQRCTMAHQ